MRWDERQRGMLARMGIRLWETPGDPGPAAMVAEAPPAAPARPARPVAPVAPDAARAQAIAAMGWPALREAVAGCRACGLCESRTQTVFGTGHPRARWFVVGEAPGEHEDLQGEPFVGRAGQLLDAMLAALGLSRGPVAGNGGDGPAAEPPGDPARQVFIANTLKCRPPRNRNPGPAEMAACTPFLERQIELVQPAVILALGRFAIDALLGSDAPVGQLRGRVHRWRGIPLVVSFHPSYLLRSPSEKARAWDDLCLAADTAEAAAAARA